MNKNNNIFLIVLISLAILMILPNISAEATNNEHRNAGNAMDIPEQSGIEVSPGVFYLGTSIHNGMLVEGYSFVHYAKDHNSVVEAKVATDEATNFKFLKYKVKWPDTMQYEVDITEHTFIGDEGNIMDILSASLETWDIAIAETSSFELFDEPIVLSGEIIDADDPQPGDLDSHNIVVWRDLGSTGAIARNSFWYNRFTGDMIDSDVEFNTHYTWADCTNSIPDSDKPVMDLQNIATHEFGHNGLNDLYMPPSTELTMHGWTYVEGEIHKRDLGLGDILGIQALYGSL